MKIGIFGGSFDPVHQGHLAVARHVREQFETDKIFFIPTLISPHKIVESPSASGEHRFKMLELAAEQDKSFRVSDAELNREGISYTVDTLKIFRRDFPKDEIFLILGADSYSHFFSWKNPEEIYAMVRFLIAPRQGCDLTLDPVKTSWISMKPFSVSSSGIRDRFRQREAVGEDLVPRKVLDYIRDHHLYQT
ncbi:MAG: nicotinate (nicotinamide) nucleotide adenylyltransferase [Candidatus Omnitrophica bacterium]|nr:nicotinate (nicotinamide) nucleotide adenylyltransferase [Candidatus Omnitrophota bacterium]